MLEDREVERLARAKPDDVARMIGAVVAGIGMGKDGQRAAVQNEPLRDVPELFRRDRQLAASARMRPDRAQMVMPFGNPELLVRSMAERLKTIKKSPRDE